jgi:UDP-N-acetylmuramoyl-L-alanyl-D-glutamate--2,6-diaminopimelate ligase
MNTGPDRSLRRLVQKLEPIAVRGSLDVTVKKIVIDSRESDHGALFAAFPGLRTDGHDYVDQAVDKGAVAILHSAALPSYRKNCCYVQVEDSRSALSHVAAAFYDYPSRDLSVIGVTGTDGKSTTVWLAYQLLAAEGKPSGFFSSVYLNTDGQVRPNPHHTSTPEAHQVQEILSRIRDGGRSVALVEATSHGLSPRTARLADVLFDVAVFTNVHQEHLEFHGSVEQYRLDKANLFRSLKPGADSFGVINRDDPHWELFAASAAPHRILTYSLDREADADLVGWPVRLRPDGTDLCLQHGSEIVEISLGLPGLFNVQNLMAAVLATGDCRGPAMENVARNAAALRPPRGRLQPVEEGQPFSVIVDFAHTPNSFSRVLPFMRELTTGRLLVVFGSAGERDLAKRPIQGQIASDYADVVILTDEDPRGEDRMEILNQIASGCRGDKEVIKLPDREEAIRRAIGMAAPGDTVLLLGKGHESSIEMAERSVDWDEEDAARSALRATSG